MLIYQNSSRKLVIYDSENAIKLIFVKAVDLPTYVVQGAADIGIVGKDTILEEQPDVYELLDLEFGKCQIVVAGFPGQKIGNPKKLTVASKYPSIARGFFRRKRSTI